MLVARPDCGHTRSEGLHDMLLRFRALKCIYVSAELGTLSGVDQLA